MRDLSPIRHALLGQFLAPQPLRHDLGDSTRPSTTASIASGMRCLVWLTAARAGSHPDLNRAALMPCCVAICPVIEIDSRISNLVVAL